MKQLEHQVRRISEYVEAQAFPEKVTHAERMMQTKVMGQAHEVWDVRTDQDRYWVVTNMTNLYSQDEFKSADYALSFHLGLMLRLMERDRSDPEPDIERVSFRAWRKHEQAVDAYNAAGEAEQFQTVGVHCREALIAFADELAEALDLDSVAHPPEGSRFQKLGRARGRAVGIGASPPCLPEVIGDTRMGLVRLAAAPWQCGAVGRGGRAGLDQDRAGCLRSCSGPARQGLTAALPTLPVIPRRVRQWHCAQRGSPRSVERAGLRRL